jgi:hypothetical protein
VAASETPHGRIGTSARGPRIRDALGSRKRRGGPAVAGLPARPEDIFSSILNVASEGIYALTASAMKHQSVEYRRAGMDGVVAKPIQVAELLQAIREARALAAELSEGGRIGQVGRDSSVLGRAKSSVTDPICKAER